MTMEPTHVDPVSMMDAEALQRRGGSSASVLEEAPRGAASRSGTDIIDPPPDASATDDFSLLIASDLSLSRSRLVHLICDSSPAASEVSSTRIVYPYQTPVSNLFPLPTSLEFFLRAVGTRGIRSGSARPVEEVEETLLQMERLLRTCLRLSLRGEVEGDTGDDSGYAFDDEEAEAMWPLDNAEDDPDDPLFWVARVPGAVDFLVACGLQRVGTVLVYRYPRRPIPKAPPPTRLILGLDLLRSELRDHAAHGQWRWASPAVPPVGDFFARFKQASDRADDPLTFPRFDDVLAWIQLRNEAFCSAICASAAVRDGDATEDDIPTIDDETWTSYYLESRDRCQELLENVDSFHATFRLRGGLINTPTTLLRESTAISRLLCRSSGKAPHGGTTPPRRHAAATPMSTIASPSERLTKTPTRAEERALFLAARPSPQRLYRDPEAEHVGLLNIRQCCFVNAFLQFVYAVPTLVSTIFSYPPAAELREWRSAQDGDTEPSEADRVHERVTHRLQAVLAFLRLSATRAINPTALLDAVAAASPIFGDGGQHDPHEFATTVFASLSSAFHTALRLRPEAATDAVAEQWRRFVELKLGAQSYTKAQLTNTSPVAATATATAPLLPSLHSSSKPPSLAWADEAPFFAVYFDDPSHGVSADAMEQAAILAGLPGYRRPSASRVLPGENPADEEPVPREAINDPATDLALALDGFFTEPLDSAAGPNTPQTGTAGRLRWLPENVDEWPALLVLYIPSRVAGGRKRFDRVSIPPAIALDAYRWREPSDAWTANETGSQHDETQDESVAASGELQRQERLATKFLVAERTDEVARAEAVLKMATEAAAAAGSLGHVQPAAAAFGNAAQLGVKISSKALQQSQEKLRELDRAAQRGLHRAHAPRQATQALLRETSDHTRPSSPSHVGDETVYDLASVIVHIGLDGGAGHYVAYARPPPPATQHEQPSDSPTSVADTVSPKSVTVDGSDAPLSPRASAWCLFDDSNVIPVDASCLDHEGVQRNVYCVCFAKRTLTGTDSSSSGSKDLVVPPPPHLRELIEKEDWRYQVQAAQALSDAS